MCETHKPLAAKKAPRTTLPNRPSQKPSGKPRGGRRVESVTGGTSRAVRTTVAQSSPKTQPKAAPTKLATAPKSNLLKPLDDAASDKRFSAETQAAVLGVLQKAIGEEAQHFGNKKGKAARARKEWQNGVLKELADSVGERVDVQKDFTTQKNALIGRVKGRIADGMAGSNTRPEYPQFMKTVR